MQLDIGVLQALDKAAAVVVSMDVSAGGGQFSEQSGCMVTQLGHLTTAFQDTCHSHFSSVFLYSFAFYVNHKDILLLQCYLGEHGGL